MSTSNENTSAPQAPIFDPFPEPQTMPSGWDLSRLVLEDGPTTADSAGETAES